MIKTGQSKSYLTPGSCLYEGTQYPEGDIPTSNPCEMIQCHQGQAMTIVAACVEDMMPHLWVCANPVKKPGTCCSSCPSGGKGKFKVNRLNYYHIYLNCLSLVQLDVFFSIVVVILLLKQLHIKHILVYTLP